MKIYFYGDYLSDSFRQQCCDNIKFLLNNEGIKHAEEDFTLTIEADEDSIKEFHVIASDFTTEAKVHHLISSNTSRISLR